MTRNNNDDWELIREEMEIEANARRFERRMSAFNALNNAFLNCFPKEKRSKVLDIETFIFSLPFIILFLYIIFH